jgi:hypothetical protein
VPIALARTRTVSSVKSSPGHAANVVFSENVCVHKVFLMIYCKWLITNRKKRPNIYNRLPPINDFCRFCYTFDLRLGNNRPWCGIELLRSSNNNFQYPDQYYEKFIPLCLFAIRRFSFRCRRGGANPSPTPPPAIDDSSKTFEVRLPVTILDKKKNLVSGFTKDDFIVLEDGVPQEVTFFTDEKTNPPVYVGVLMDTSSSTKGKMSFSKQAAKDFIYTVTRCAKTKAAFMTFDHEINLVQDFTDKLDLLDKAVDKVIKPVRKPRFTTRSGSSRTKNCAARRAAA